MTKPHEHWTVLPHGRLAEIDDGILTVVGEIKMPLMTLPRRMTVIRLRDARLLIWSAIALDEPEMDTLDRMGEPAFLVVPNDHHRLDAKIWKERYPNVRVVAPAGARDRIQEVVTVDTSVPDLNDPDVRITGVPGTREQELALIVTRSSGTTLVLNDLVGNIRHASGFGGWLLRLMGFAGEEAHIPAPVMRLLVKDKDALRAQLMNWSEMKGLRRILVAHGDPIVSDPRQVLRDLANTLT